MSCTFSFIFFLYKLISLWARKFSCGLLKIFVQGPTWPVENFIKLDPCYAKVAISPTEKPVLYNIYNGIIFPSMVPAKIVQFNSQ